MYYINTDELEDDSKTGCPRCIAQGNDTSLDNFHWYNIQDGGYCYSCGFTIPSEEYKEESNSNLKAKGNKNMITSKDIDNLKNKALTAEQVAEIEAKTFTDIPKPYRGVPSEVYKSLGVRWEKNGKEVSMYYPITVVEDGNKRVVGYKIRKHPKEFYSVGYVGKLGGFLNQSNAIADTLIICSGEIDLASAIYGLELDKYRKSYNVVSSSLGEDSTATMIKLNYDWVNAHKKIVACMDDDEAGEKAFEKIKEVIDADKLYKANLKYNDLNDMLKNNAANEIANAIYWSPTPCKTYGLAASSSMFDKMLEVIDVEKIPLPPFLCGLDEALAGGIALGEVVNIVSSVSTGKTSFINSILMHWIMHSPHRILIISLEDNIASYTMKLSSRVSGVNIAALRTSEEKHEVLNKNRAEIEKYLVDENGAARFDIMEKVPPTLEELKTAILQAIKVYGTRLIVLDPIVSLIGTKSLDEQGEWMLFEEETRRDYSVTWVNIAHVRKSGSGEKAHSEGGNFSEESIKGSSQISATATTNILLRRNKMSDDPIERNTTYVSISKNRSTGITGSDITKVYYSNATQLMTDFNYAQENNFFEGMTAQEVRGMMDVTKSAVEVEEINEDSEVEDIEIIDCF